MKKKILIIRTRQSDPTAEEIGRAEATGPDEVILLDWSADSRPDYDAALDSIFAADSVQVW